MLNRKLHDKILGSLLGVAIGDALGATVEFCTADEIRYRYGRLTEITGGGAFGIKAGDVTDDTQMTIAVAEGIIRAEESAVSITEAIGSEFIEWYLSNPPDVGMTCQTAIKIAGGNLRGGMKPEAAWRDAAQATAIIQGGKTDGNGALMRTIYPALYYANKRRAVYVADVQSQLTHAGKVSRTTCRDYVSVIYDLVHAENQSAAIEQMEEGFSEYDADVMRLTAIPFPTGYSLNSLGHAIGSVYNSASFEGAVTDAVNLGGDADTIGAITGGLAGALYGAQAIPERWRRALNAEITVKLTKLADAAFLHQAQSEYPKG